MTQATASYMAMLRGAIALAWEDGRLHAEEQDRLRDIIRHNVVISEEQRLQLLDDIDEQTELGEIWDKITNMHDRAHLLNLALALCHEDGDYSEQERAAYERINSLHLATLDEAALQSELRIMARASEQRLKEEREEDYNAMNPIEKFLFMIENSVTSDYAQAG